VNPKVRLPIKALIFPDVHECRIRII